MPDQPDFHGVLPALVTPFTGDGTAIDAEALAAIVERLVRGGVGGLVPGGSTGEFTTLTNAERRELVELTVAAAAGRVPVVAGTGALSTRETVELSLHAERSGAAAVMVVPPFYDVLSWRELLAHYAAVAERIAIPIMYYNLPSVSGVTLDAARWRELRDVAGVTSLKDTGGDAVAATELIQAGDERPDAAQRVGHADVRGARGRRAGRRLGHGVDPPRGVRRAASPPHRRHRPPGGAGAVVAPVAAVPVPRGAELPGRGEGRVRARGRQDRPDARAAARPHRRGARRAAGAGRASA